MYPAHERVQVEESQMSAANLRSCTRPESILDGAIFGRRYRAKAVSSIYGNKKNVADYNFCTYIGGSPDACCERS